MAGFLNAVIQMYNILPLQKRNRKNVKHAHGNFMVKKILAQMSLHINK